MSNSGQGLFECCVLETSGVEAARRPVERL